MLVSQPCRSACSWHPLGERDPAGQELWACGGCASEWVRGEPWVPVDADGGRHPALAAEAAARAAG